MKNIWKIISVALAVVLISVLAMGLKPSNQAKEVVSLRIYNYSGSLRTMITASSNGNVSSVDLPPFNSKNAEETARIINTELTRLVNEGYSIKAAGGGPVENGASFEFYVLEK